MLNIGIVGASGYTGIELIKILSKHHRLKINHIFSKQYKGQSFKSLFPDFPINIDLIFQEFDPVEIDSSIDVLFLAMPHANSHLFLEKLINKKIKVVDLSADFRLKDPKLFKSFYNMEHKSVDLLDSVVLGWPELYREQLKKANASFGTM